MDPIETCCHLTYNCWASEKNLCIDWFWFTIALFMQLLSTISHRILKIDDQMHENWNWFQNELEIITYLVQARLAVTVVWFALVIFDYQQSISLMQHQVFSIENQSLLFSIQFWCASKNVLVVVLPSQSISCFIVWSQIWWEAHLRSTKRIWLTCSWLDSRNAGLACFHLHFKNLIAKVTDLIGNNLYQQKAKISIQVSKISYL